MAPVERWAVLDEEGLVVNVILWNPTHDYESDAPMLQLPDDSPVCPGWKLADDEWIAPQQPEEPEEY